MGSTQSVKIIPFSTAKKDVAAISSPTPTNPLHTLSDTQLVASLLSPQSQAAHPIYFEELVRRHQQMVYSLAFRFFGNHADADEICQKTFLRVFRKLASFQGKSAFKTWLYRITLNLCKNYSRDEKRHQKIKQAHEPNPPEGLEKDLPKGVVIKHPQVINAKWGQQPAQQLHALEQREEHLALAQAIATLPKTQRMVVSLRVFEDLAFQEIAAILKCSTSAAKTNFHYGLKKLKELLRTETKK